VAAYRAALEERTRERVPLAWAYSQQGLSIALAAMAERSVDPTRMEEAISCTRGAIEVYRRNGETKWLAVAERRAGEMQAELTVMNMSWGEMNK
jgi:hypothetical protein